MTNTKTALDLGYDDAMAEQATQEIDMNEELSDDTYRLFDKYELDYTGVVQDYKRGWNRFVEENK